ncbi:uncharacterized protein V1518DRAFT_18805 [Limtongia smithiae]|uniref:uncharacterized protein n=1 Tax=Limtongia smithiae TaxID=1125753 RepID=UPI0034CFAD3C
MVPSLARNIRLPGPGARRLLHALARAGPEPLTTLHPTSLVGRRSQLSGRLEPLIRDHKHDLADSWSRLLHSLDAETRVIQALGSSIIPVAKFGTDIDIDAITGLPIFKSSALADDIRKRGVVVIRDVIPADLALALKEEAEEYVENNSSSIITSTQNPSLYDVYWSKAQVQARSHPNVLEAQSLLMGLWRSSKLNTPLSVGHPLSYADRMHFRSSSTPEFSLGPHIDSGPIMRWSNPESFNVYEDVFSRTGWESYDAFDYARRFDTVPDFSDGSGSCSVFRMFQGWLSLTRTGHNDGSLKVYPLLQQATAYAMLRPLFSITGDRPSPSLDTFLTGRELMSALYPHLDFENAMVSLPAINPGDYVAWHPDMIHSLDPTFMISESAGIYLPAVPLTIPNARYLVEQREAFESLTPPPDFPIAFGQSESTFLGSGTEMDALSEDGLRAAGFGYAKWDEDKSNSFIEHSLLKDANKIVFSKTAI